MNRKLSFLLTLTALVAALGLAIGGCELSDDADADGTTTTQTDTGGTNTNTTQTDTNVVGPQYRFVRIDDLSDVTASEDGGADIDAIILTKTDGSVFYADNVEASFHGGVDGLQLDPNDILGEPDAFFEYPDVTNCRVDNGFMSLGGLSGFVVVRMAGVMEANDDLTTLEVGGCAWSGGEAFIEDIKVSISVGSDPAGTWVNLGQGFGPEVSFTIP